MRMFRTNVEKIRTHIFCWITSFRKSRRLWDNVGKYCRAGQASWQDGARLLHAAYLRPQTHTQSVWWYCFSTARVDARTRLNVTLYVHCLVLFLYIHFTVRNSDSLVCVTHSETHSGCAEIVIAVQREVRSVLVWSTCVYNIGSCIG